MTLADTASYSDFIMKHVELIMCYNASEEMRQASKGHFLDLQGLRWKCEVITDRISTPVGGRPLSVHFLLLASGKSDRQAMEG